MDIWDENVMDGILEQFALFIDDKSHILIHHISNVRNNRAHENIDFEKNIE